jgi:hypothetical protein
MTVGVDHAVAREVAAGSIGGRVPPELSTTPTTKG